jgi:hypothetical protein
VSLEPFVGRLGPQMLLFEGGTFKLPRPNFKNFQIQA